MAIEEQVLLPSVFKQTNQSNKHIDKQTNLSTHLKLDKFEDFFAIEEHVLLPSVSKQTNKQTIK